MRFSFKHLLLNECQITITFIVVLVAGPTIAEDKELLEATQNPILIELRKEKQSKGSGKLDKSKLEEKIEELRKEYEEIKKKRYKRVSFSGHL